jgi:ADP-heptose:LPS heptosyltransferase
MKVLIIKPSSLGDVVHALRVVSFLKEQIKSLEIHWVIKKGLEGIIDASGIVDKYFLFNRGEGLREYLKLGFTLRRQSYDLVLDMQGLLRSSFLAKLAKGRRCFGRTDGRECATLFYKTVNFPAAEDCHAIEKLCKFIEVFNLRPYGDLNLNFNKSTLEIKDKLKPDSSNKRILLFPETRRLEKSWPFFKELNDLLQNEKTGDVLISGTVRDDSYLKSYDYRGDIPLRSLPALIRQASIVISNDSAPLHIASALNVPVLGIFGPTSPKLYGPYPINSKNGDTISSHTGLISDISIGDVFKKIVSMLHGSEQ